MKKLTIEVHLSIGYAGADHDDVLEVEVPDDATPEQIEAEKELALKEWAFGYIDYYFIDKP